MTSDYIHKTARRAVKKHGEDDPARLARELGFIVLYQNMGTDETSCKGFFIRQSKVTAIVVNGDLPLRVRRLVIAHELGHALLHAEQLESGLLGDASIFDSGSLMEYQADMFAAELLIPDDKAKRLFRAGATFYQAATVLGVPEELLDYKLRSLRNRGFEIDAPEFARSGYLRHIN